MKAYSCVLFVFSVVAGASAGHAATEIPTYDRGDALEISQGAIGRTLGDYTLRDTNGQPFSLSALRGKPIVVSMIYTSCHHICPSITPDRMREFEKRLGSDGVPNWHFLATEAQVVDELSDNLGFLFFPSAKGFDHLAQATIIDADGRIYRQVYGVDVETTAIVEPLKELVFNTPRSAGFLAHWVSTFRLFCTVYDPNNDRYRFDYSIFTAIVTGVLSLGLVLFFIVREWRHTR